MKKELKILEIEKINFNNKYYPRTHYSEATANRYFVAMQQGEVFPPIVVADIEDAGYYLLDGLHRLRAYQKNNDKTIQCEVLYGLSLKELYFEAIKYNTKHGLPYTDYDKTEIIKKLHDMKYDIDTISKTINISHEFVSDIVAQRDRFKLQFRVGKRGRKDHTAEPDETKRGIELKNYPKRELNSFVIRRGLSKRFILSKHTKEELLEILNDECIIAQITGG